MKEKRTRASGEDPTRGTHEGRRAVAEAEQDDGRWVSVYVAVVIVTVLVIASLWLFSRVFSS